MGALPVSNALGAAPFSREHLDELLELAARGIEEIAVAQEAAFA